MLRTTGVGAAGLSGTTWSAAQLSRSTWWSSAAAACLGVEESHLATGYQGDATLALCLPAGVGTVGNEVRSPNGSKRSRLSNGRRRTRTYALLA